MPKLTPDLYLMTHLAENCRPNKTRAVILALMERTTHAGRWMCVGANVIRTDSMQRERERLYRKVTRLSYAVTRYAIVEVTHAKCDALCPSLYTEKWAGDWGKINMVSLTNYCRDAWSDSQANRRGKHSARSR